MNQLCKDTDLEVISLSHSMETVREKLDDRINEHKNSRTCSRFNGAYCTNKYWCSSC